MDKEDVVHLYNEILLRYKKEWNNAICSNMDWPRDYHAKWSESDRERQIPYDTAYMWSQKKMIQTNSLQNRNRLTDIENKLMVTKGEAGGRNKLGIWD